jgi:hypothetical protein
MNNIGIILNQDNNNNQSYLGKFYQRNRLEFPVIRKIYEQIETSKMNSNTNNQIIVENSLNNSKNNSIVNDITISDEGYVNANANDIENEIINKQMNNDNEDIIILDKSNYTSIKNKGELNVDNLDTIDTVGTVGTVGTVDTIGAVSTLGTLGAVDTVGTVGTLAAVDTLDTANIPLHKNDEPKIDNTNKITKNNKISNVLDLVQFNNSELVFLWLSSVLLLFSIEYNIFKNFVS